MEEEVLPSPLALPPGSPPAFCFTPKRHLQPTETAANVAAPPTLPQLPPLWRPRRQVVASFGQRALFEVFPCLWLLEMAGAYGVFRGYVYTLSAIPACPPPPTSGTSVLLLGWAACRKVVTRPLKYLEMVGLADRIAKLVTQLDLHCGQRLTEHHLLVCRWGVMHHQHDGEAWQHL